MRIIDVCDAAVAAVAVAPDGRFVAASGADSGCAVYDWASGNPVRRLPLGVGCDQFAFVPGDRVAYVHRGALRIDRLDDTPVPPQPEGEFAGGVAVSPDGKRLVATRTGPANQAKLACWGLPAVRPTTGFDYWSPLRKLAFSPDGQFLAGIWQYAFELRFAASGGLDVQNQSRATWRRGRAAAGDPVGFVSFTRDSGTCAFGWDGEVRVLDIATGTSKEVRRVDAPFRDAAFTGSGRHLATVEGTGRLKLWDVKAWQVAREYDWECGPLTCLAFTADGTAGVCGTADGRLVQFDVDE